MALRNKISLLGIFLVGLLPACGGGSFTAPTSGGPATATSSGEGEALAFFPRNGSLALTEIRDVYVGEVVPLELRGVGEEEVALWYSSDTTRGAFTRPGELHLSRTGTFQIRAQVGTRAITLQVTVGAQRPSPDPENNPPVTSSSPSPVPLPTPVATASPTPAPIPTPTPTALPTPLPSPTPAPTPLPSPTPVASASPLPTPVASDPFVDEVTSFDPGAHAGFGSDRFPDVVLGAPKGGGLQTGGFDVLSLGQGGTIVLKSAAAILDGPGKDFIVFENAFYAGGNPLAPFAEPGEVAVSQDGTHFVAFPCASGNRDEMYPGCAGVHPVLANADTNSIDPLDPAAAGGDAFDLHDLGLAWARYIRIRDLSEGGGGNSAGFDLDAVSIIHQRDSSI